MIGLSPFVPGEIGNVTSLHTGSTINQYLGICHGGGIDQPEMITIRESHYLFLE